MYACMYAYVLESSPFYYAHFWLAYAVLQLAGPTAHTAHGRLSFPSLSLSALDGLQFRATYRYHPSHVEAQVGVIQLGYLHGCVQRVLYNTGS